MANVLPFGQTQLRKPQHLWRVSAGGQQAVLCAVHAVRWLRERGALLRILPMPTLPPQRRQIQASEALRRQFRVKT